MLEDLAALLFGMESITGQAVSSEELARLAGLVGEGRSVEVFLRGRAPGQGWVLWVLSGEHFVRLGGRRGSREVCYPVADVRRVETVMGYWGASVDIELASGLEQVFGADRAASDDFATALARRAPGVAAPAPLSPPEPPPQADEPERRASERSEAESARKAPLEELASLRERGLLTPEAYEELRRRLEGSS